MGIQPNPVQSHQDSITFSPSEVKMLGLTIILLVFSTSSSLPVKRQAETEAEYEYEYEYEDVLDEHGNVVYDYVLTEEHQTTSNGAINPNKACHKRFINQICVMKCGKRYSRC